MGFSLRPAPKPLEHFDWKRTTVRDRAAQYGVAGTGTPVLFLHGWGLGQHAYKRTLKRLVDMGCRVYAPALPGFGGTAELPGRLFSFEGYADWVEGFCEAVHLDEPAFVLGHSFGGGVSIRFAHDFPSRVRTLVLINSVGGSAWASRKGIRTMAERPLWDWGLHFPQDVLVRGQLNRILPIVLEDALPNVLRNPLAMVKVGNLARTADLTGELEELKRRQLPVVVVWGAHDGIVPRESFDALCLALGSDGEVVDGSHNWLLADPDAFGEVMTNVLSVAKLARTLEGGAEGPAVLEVPTLRNDPPAG